MCRVAVVFLKVLYFVCPFLAIGSVIWYIIGDVGIWVTLFFWIFGFLGMFSGSAAKQLAEQSLLSGATSHDPIRRAKAALAEIENEITGVRIIKQEILDLLSDKERTASSIFDDHLDPKALVYLLITNVAYSRLSSGVNSRPYRAISVAAQ